MPWASASSARAARRPVSTMSLTTPVPAHLEAAGRRRRCRGSRRRSTSGSMNRAPSAAMRMSHSSARWNEPPIAQPLQATMTGASRSNSCWMPRWPRRISSWWRQLDLPVADRADVAARRERLALAPPDHGPHVGPALQLAEDLEQPLVHVVVEGVVLLGVVVGDRGDRAVDVEPHPCIRRRLLVGHVPPSCRRRRGSPSTTRREIYEGHCGRRRTPWRGWWSRKPGRQARRARGSLARWTTASPPSRRASSCPRRPRSRPPPASGSRRRPPRRHGPQGHLGARRRGRGVRGVVRRAGHHRGAERGAGVRDVGPGVHRGQPVRGDRRARDGRLARRRRSGRPCCWPPATRPTAWRWPRRSPGGRWAAASSPPSS